MIQSMKRKPFTVATLALGILLVVGVLTFAGPCVHDDGSHSTCYAASCAALAAGVVVVASSAVSLLSPNATLHKALSVVSALAGVLAAASPGGIFELCMMQTMRCWTVMRPFSLVIGILICLCAVVAAVGAMRAKEGAAS